SCARRIPLGAMGAGLRLLAPVLLACQHSTQTTRSPLGTPAIVSPAAAPAGSETLAVQWIKVAGPGRGRLGGAVARPVRRRAIPCRHSLAWQPWIRTAVCAIGSGIGARWAARGRGVLVFWRRRSRLTFRNTDRLPRGASHAQSG